MAGHYARFVTKRTVQSQLKNIITVSNAYLRGNLHRQLSPFATRSNSMTTMPRAAQTEAILRRDPLVIHPQLWRNLSADSQLHALGIAADEDWPEHEFVQVAEANLEQLSDQISDLGFRPKNASMDFDIELSQGVLTISFGSHGTYVLNTQTPNRQIWMSSPTSGPWRYAWYPEKNSWFSTRDGHALSDRLTQELSEIFNERVEISFSDVNLKA